EYGRQVPGRRGAALGGLRHLALGFAQRRVGTGEIGLAAEEFLHTRARTARGVVEGLAVAVGFVGGGETLHGVLLRRRTAGLECFRATALDVGVGLDTGRAGVVVAAAGSQRQDRGGENADDGAAALELHSSPPDTSCSPGPSP